MVATSCPHCGSPDVKYVKKSPLGGGFIHRCLKCKKEFTIDRIASPRKGGY